MKRLFFSSAYNVQHSTITPENATEKLASDIRSQMLGSVEKFLYAKVSPLEINPQLEYVGGFYYEPQSKKLSACASTVKAELDEINQADIVMVSLLKYSAIATITELLYAARFPEKEIIIFCDSDITQFKVEYEYWFPILAAQRTTQNLRVVYVKNDNEILNFIKNLEIYPKRIIIEGTDGIGKTTLARNLQNFGLHCLDREKEHISAIMFPENSDAIRLQTCQQYLLNHPNDFLIFLTTSRPEELQARIQKRGNSYDKFDQEAAMYNALYDKTAQQIEATKSFDKQFAKIDVYNYQEDAVTSIVLEKLLYNGFMQKIVFATNNPGKLAELRQMFPEYLMLSLKDVLHEKLDIEEDADSFLGNATKKAIEIYAAIKLRIPIIADDSGLMIDALNGFPGVLTHRFLGENTSDEERNAEIIRRVSGKDRTARFICELVYYDGNKIVSGHGELVGKIAENPRGENGFGFDPIFELADGRTLAELLPAEKKWLSARYSATIDLKQKLRV